MSKLLTKSWPSSSVFGEHWDIFDSLFSDLNLNRLLDVKVDYPMDYSYSENESEVYIDIPLAGHNKDDIEVTVQDGYLNVSVKSQEKRKDVKYFRNGLSQKSRSWKWDILESGEQDGVKSTFADGLLSITIPKKKKELPVVKKIAIE